MGMFWDAHFAFKKSTNRQENDFGVHETCTDLCGTVGVWITATFKRFFLKLERQNTLRCGQKNARF